jgi:glycosyltransferase involved in cell wall biosynthesis
MRIWLVTVAEPIPSDGVRPMRFMGIADQLVARGHEVTIWTTSFSHHAKRHRFATDTTYEVRPRYTVSVLRSWGYKRNISLSRFAAHWHFAHRLQEALSQAMRPDVILVSLPPLDSVAATVAFGRQHDIPVIVDVIDPWPEVFLSLAPAAGRGAVRLALLPLYWQARVIFRRAAAVTAISATYASWAKQLAKQRRLTTAVFYPAIDLAGFDALVQHCGGYRRGDSATPLRCIYAGALGHSYDVETLILAARQLLAQRDANVEFLIAGSGPKSEALQAMAQGLSNVKFLGWVGAEGLAELFASSHIGIACYGKRATQTVTYKLFDYLAAGLPILCSLPGEMGAIIEREAVGWRYPPENPSALAAQIRELVARRDVVATMSEKARAFAARSGDARIVYRHMAQFIEQLALTRAYGDREERAA